MNMGIALSPEMLALTFGGMILFLGIVVMSLGKGKTIGLAGKLFQNVDDDILKAEEKLREIAVDESIAKKDDGMSWLQKKQRELIQSNTGITISLYVVIMAVSMLVIFLAIYAIMGNALIPIPFAFLGLLVPEKIVKFKLDGNIKSFNSQLVKALRRMASGMRAGSSLKQALMDVAKARTMPVIIRAEFRKALQDMEYGLKIEEALYNMYTRTGSKDVQFLAIAIEIQRQLGGNMAQTFDTISSSISNRNLMENDVRATLAQVNATSTILSLMPFGMIGLLFFISPGYFAPLFETFIGKFVFLGCIGFVFIGIFVMKKMSKIEL